MPDNMPTPLFEVNLGPGVVPFRPATAQEVVDFLDAEQAAWSWAFESEPMTQSGIDTPNQFRLQLKQLRTLASQFVNDPGNRDQMLGALSQAYSPQPGQPRLIASASEDGAFVLSIRESMGDMAAAGAMAPLSTRPSSTSVPAVQLGVLAGTSHLLGINPITPVAAKKALEGTRTKLNTAFSTYDSRFTQLHNEGANLINSQIRRGKALARLALRKQKKLGHALTVQMTDAVADLKAVEAAYREQMALKAPVEYWRSKASAHEGKAKRQQKWASIYGATATVTLLVGLSCLASYALKAATPVVIGGQPYTAPPAVFFILATIGVVASTIAFWVGRIFVRLYLSELHLGMDARERETMVQTYLALIAERATEGTDDRHIVLSSLFRPTADGIVKEEGPQDPSLAGVLARVLDGGPKRP
ncbi:MAG: hypothetical protein EOS52_25015 [Mesorhizobium sp.]|uniref:DUF6161 domain-containing protein n=1 Tax=Mesorhizobium sp. TaxID=1871066 RepID=UPI000FE6B161|nr:DUF6161 domain-containing protein [Mesorhizobium sp.]RWC10375.1 MAG: hypothetical protein EOS52_25015 [Mesorhizobium sp.]